MTSLARVLRLALSVSALLFASTASAVSIDWVLVGNAGNAADTTGHGAVAYAYQISKYEVTNSQYAEFLSWKAVADPLGLYNASMTSDSLNGGITRTGVSGSYIYTAKLGFENKPVNYVSLFDSMRFSNWLNNGQLGSDTETGAYTLTGGTATPSNYTTIVRNALATSFLPSQNEWYKAAYFNGASYFDYPTSSDTPTTCASPSAAANQANCYRFTTPLVTNVGAYTGSASPYGTFDQGGNVWEWTDTFNFAYYRIVRGGSISEQNGALHASYVPNYDPASEFFTNGFRVATTAIPEPGTALLVMMGLLGLAAHRRRQR